MSRITLHSKCRLCRTEGTKLYLKGARCVSAKCPIEKKGAVLPGMHGAKRAKKPTDYGIQLRAKQKAKRIYGVQETQFRNYFDKAKRLEGLVGENLIKLVEKRLDNVIYLVGLAQSRTQAKQLISHKHIFINGKALNIASYSVKLGDVISFNPKTVDTFKDNFRLDDKDFKTPSWLSVNTKDYSAKIASQPNLDEIDRGIDINLIIEYYSR
jgi:small subunit ribosomal protein S4